MYRNSSEKCMLRHKELELGLPMVYWRVHCGEKKHGCVGDELICYREE
jgi:hypothetical protein